MNRTLERQTTLTLLGIRFWDPATDRQVSDGLTVVARPQTAPHLAVAGRRTPSGVYAFQGLPGLETAEYPLIDPPPGNPFGQPPDQPPASPPQTHPYWVDVVDRHGRFSPLRFDLTLPLPYRGVYRPAANGSPPENSPDRIYLFSSPARQAAPGLAVIRTCLQVRATGEPAAFALLEVEVAGRRWYGVADRRGCTAVFLPYPTFITQLGTSPPGLPPADQQWPVTVRLRHDPDLIATLDAGTIPDLRQIRNQPQVSLWPTADHPADEAGWILTYGAELILRTDERPILWLGPLAEP
jgi:hypothetical protein